jgi:nitroreductase
MNFRELSAARYSVREFSGRPVEGEKLDLILEAGRNAPTAANRQPHRILVIDSGEGLLKLDRCTSCRYGAPLALLVSYDKGECWVRKFDNEHSGIVDASIVTTQMMFQAGDLGLGSLWVMHFDPAAVRESFRLPESLVPVALLILGYAAREVPPDRRSFQHPRERLVYRGDFSGCSPA